MNKMNTREACRTGREVGQETGTRRGRYKGQEKAAEGLGHNDSVMRQREHQRSKDDTRGTS